MRLLRSLLPILIALPLAGCELFEDKDWREGVETAEDCAARMSGKLEVRQLLEAADGQVVPIYAFDITKMDLNSINEMIVPATDGSRGSLRTSAFGATAPPVAAFMELDVTEDGAFYFGEDPSIYRVRGKPTVSDDIVSTGCAMQQDGMRVFSFKLEGYQVEPEPSDDEGAS